MSHLSGKCNCGRTQHFPKTAKIGDKWTCWSCGKTWTIVNSGGKPLNRIKSKIKKRIIIKKKPVKNYPTKYKQNKPRNKHNKKDNSNSGCMATLVLIFSSLLAIIILFFT